MKNFKKIKPIRNDRWEKKRKHHEQNHVKTDFGFRFKNHKQKKNKKQCQLIYKERKKGQIKQIVGKVRRQIQTK